ncbi:MAG TPA: HAMP domain-containing sensor histidine kinase [Anaerolineaceae bacterium]|nr:HAMP domain-containing sensor histidine kinase [Anaerolineaceae bacterium]
MLRSLRNWLILSHILPLLIVIPLLGITLNYVLETRFLIPQLTRTISGNALLIAELSQGQADVWNNSSNAQTWLQRINPGLASRVMFLTPDCRLLATSNPADAGRIDTALGAECQAVIQSQNTVIKSNLYDTNLNANVIDVLAPVIGADQQMIGIVRLTYPYASTFMQLFEVRSLIAAFSLLGITAGVTIGIFLALKISKPIQQVTTVVYNLARGVQREQLPEKGPEEVKLLSEGVNFLITRMENLEQARRRLLSNLVHELSRPLGALRSANQAILEGADKDPRFTHELLVGMDEEMGRLQNLLQSLRQHYDQALGTLELNRQAIPLFEWISHLVLPWQEAALQKQLKWEVSIPRDLPTIYADPVRLAQAVENLISNAIKFTPVGGMVSITAGCRNEIFWIQVSDTGPGIPEEEQNNIFTPFYRGNQRRRFPQGMGLGLSIARDITIAHGGKLELDSAPGKGTSFKLSLPILHLNTKSGINH